MTFHLIIMTVIILTFCLITLTYAIIMTIYLIISIYVNSNQIKSLLLSHHHSTCALMSEILTSLIIKTILP